MKFFSDYVPVADDNSHSSVSDKDGLLQDVEYPATPYSTTRRRLKIPLWVLVSLQFFLIAISGGIGFFAGNSAVNCKCHLETTWDELKRDGLSYETKIFDGHFVDKSEFQGAPNPELDKRWEAIAQLFQFGVDEETLHKANKTKGLVNYPGTSKYMVGIEVFHQLHCLNYIRMYTYMDYYEKINPDMLVEPLEERTNHKDHCIDMLRQWLMCRPDVNVYAFQWVDTRDHPFTKFSTQHTCVNWELFFAWSKTQLFLSPVLEKPDGIETLD